jgi:hypothetical protein
MDRDRLKEIHQTDLTESRVNEDFVDWLKTKGPTWLLVILIAVCAYLAVIRFRQGRAQQQSEAWTAYFSTELPSSLVDVADEYAGVGHVASLCYLKAADALLVAVQDGKVLGAIDPANPNVPPDPAMTLTPEDRDGYLERADAYYTRVVDSGLPLLVVAGLHGRAAVAECRGDSVAAAEFYARAAEAAAPTYPALAEVANARADTAEEYSTEIEFRSQRELTEIQGSSLSPDKAEIDDAWRDLLLPPEDDDETSE